MTLFDVFIRIAKDILSRCAGVRVLAPGMKGISEMASIILKNASRWVARILPARDGSVIVIAALCLPVIIGCVGLAVDYGRSVLLHRRAQAALDAAVLAASNALVPERERNAMFETHFKENFGKDFSSISRLEYTHSQSAGGVGTVTIVSKPLFMLALGQKAASHDLSSVAQVEDGVDVEVALALDISGSMFMSDMGGGGTRLDALKSASRMLIETIMANKGANQQVRFSVVPFNMAVNVGQGNANIVMNTAHPLFKGTTWGGCVLERKGGYHAKDTYSPGATDGSGKWPAYIWPPEPDRGRRCINISDGTNAGYASVERAPLGLNPLAFGPNFNCPRFPLTRLTASDAEVLKAIDGLEAFGNLGTTVGPAVGWAMRLLSPTGPFGDAAPFSPKTRKLLVVVTDGEMVTDGGSCIGATNTAIPYKFDPADFGLQGKTLSSGPKNDSFTPYGYIQDSDPYNRQINSTADANLELDRLAIDACTEAKKRFSGEGAIDLFTIAASRSAGPGTRAFAVLAACASKRENFLYAEDAAKLDDAFRAIAKQAIKLHLTQ